MGVFGFDTSASSGGDFLPIVKYDSRAGRLFRVERVQTAQGWERSQVDITNSFKAVFDLDNIETGWINFPTSGAPQYVMVPIGQPIPPNPGQGFKNGIRFLIKLDGASAGGAAAIREMSSNAKAFVGGMEELYNAYTAQKAANPGKLPVVVLKTTTPVTSGTGAQKSTNYVPEWEIVGWAPRPQDLTAQPRQAAPAPANVPPSTGSTIAPPPAAAAPAYADADFG